jgi:hypothetical protein
LSLPELTYDEIMIVYAVLRGQKQTDHSWEEHHDFAFHDLYLSVSTLKKSRHFEIAGQVTWGDHTSAEGLVRIASDGLTIQDGLHNFTIPNTEILLEEAGLDIFIAAKDAGGEDESEEQRHGASQHAKDKALSHRASRFAVSGVVRFEGCKVSVGYHLERTKGESKGDWLVYGRVEDLPLHKILPAATPESGFDIMLRDVALIASSKDHDDAYDWDSIEEEDQLDAKVDEPGYHGTEQGDLSKSKHYPIKQGKLVPIS